MLKSLELSSRLKAAGIHFLISVLVVIVAGVVVLLWYPYPYRQISGAVDLLLLIFFVDVVLGPAITFFIFDRRKKRSELIFDMLVVVFIQVCAISYGLWSAYAARPVYLVFEIDRFRVVHASELDRNVPTAFSSAECNLILCEPYLIAVRQFKDEREKLNATMLALQGVSLAAQSNLWTSYKSSVSEVLGAAKPINGLIKEFPDKLDEVTRIAIDAGISSAEVLYLPLVGRREYWTILLSLKNGDVLGYVPVDGFEIDR